MSQIPSNNQEGEPGQPGEPGSPGTGGGGTGGAGGAGGRGGKGGAAVIRGRGRLYGLSTLSLIFISVLALAIFVFAYDNAQRHNQITEAEYTLCQKAQRIADNQRRMIVALIAIETRENEHPTPHLAELGETLALVPDFNCEQFKEGG